MPVYGNQLAAFPELMREYGVFKMNPRIGAGYGERYDKRTVTGYFSQRKSKRAELVGGLAVQNDEATFWEQHDFQTGESRIEQLEFMEAKGRLWRFVEEDNFGDEGGFTRWTVQRVAGNTDRQTANMKVDEAVRDDYE
jgi:hypothetical protein